MKFRAVILLVLISILFLAHPVMAQTEIPPTPTVTPTPAYLQDVPLTSGHVLHVERTISYGDVAIVIALLVVWITFLVSQMVKIPKEMMRR